MSEISNVDLFFGDDLLIQEALSLYKSFLNGAVSSPNLTRADISKNLTIVDSALQVLSQEIQGLTADECRLIYISLQYYEDHLKRKLSSPFADQITNNLYSAKKDNVERIKSQYALIFKNNGIDVQSFFKA